MNKNYKIINVVNYIFTSYRMKEYLRQTLHLHHAGNIQKECRKLCRPLFQN